MTPDEARQVERASLDSQPDVVDGHPISLRTKGGVANQIRAIFMAQEWAPSDIIGVASHAGVDREFKRLEELSMAALREILAVCEDRQKADRDSAG